LKNKLKNLAKLLLKIGLSGLAVYWVLQKIDLEALTAVLRSTHFGWLLLAALAFNASKIVSSFRLNAYFNSPVLQLRLANAYHLKLYYIGMFYNLFLPGGIGGDGYKVYVLHKYLQKPLKALIAATLIDRLNGLVSLVFYTLLILFFLPTSLFPFQSGISILLALLIFPLFYGFCHWFFPSFNDWSTFFRSNSLSLVVQLLQLVAAYCIYMGIGASGLPLSYLFLFLLSSVVAVLPLTIGGVGARELVFVYGTTLFDIASAEAVGLSVLFFMITALSSLVGILFSEKPKTD
jgi:glycosyltransferase 2 family protein